MLYATTRDKLQVYTHPHVLCQDAPTSGGAFVPFHLPKLSGEEMEVMAQSTFGQNVAWVLNLFLGSNLDSREVDFAIGHNPAKLVSLGQRMVVAELWHNLDGSFDSVKRTLHKMAVPTASETAASEWCSVAIDIAFLFGIYAELTAQNLVSVGQSVDIPVSTDDLSAIAAVLYARKMGLPVGMMIISCEEGCVLWDLLKHGEFSAKAAGKLQPSQRAEYLMQVERLLCEYHGVKTVSELCSAIENGAVFACDTTAWHDALYASVVSRKRLPAVASILHKNTKVIVDPETAFSVSGLQDYRAKTGENKPAVILMKHSPLRSSDAVCDALNLSPAQLRSQIGLL